jgi:hypothetical protein
MMQVVCSWHGGIIGYKPGPHGVSHGICKECSEKVLAVQTTLKPIMDVLAASPGMKAAFGGKAYDK